MARYRAANLEEIKARSAHDYAKHTEAYKRRAKTAYERNRDEVKLRTAEYQILNKDKKAAWGAKYRAGNKHKISAKTAKRKSQKLLATPSWASEKAMLEFYREANEMTARTGVAHHVDHIVPLLSAVVCGLHCEANLRVIPASENTSKSNRHWPDMP